MENRPLDFFESNQQDLTTQESLGGLLGCFYLFFTFLPFIMALVVSSAFIDDHFFDKSDLDLSVFLSAAFAGVTLILLGVLVSFLEWLFLRKVLSYRFSHIRLGILLGLFYMGLTAYLVFY